MQGLQANVRLDQPYWFSDCHLAGTCVPNYLYKEVAVLGKELDLVKKTFVLTLPWSLLVVNYLVIELYLLVHFLKY